MTNPELNPDFISELRAWMQQTDDSIKSLGEKVDKIDATLTPIAEAWSGMQWGKKVITGLGSAIIALAAVGGATLWLYNFVRHGTN